MDEIEYLPASARPAAPLCSVCIANYNGAALLGDCLDSVFAQCVEFSIEVIVHDDASTDDSVGFLRAKFPQVELLASRTNVGFCTSNNRMVAHARGEFVLLLNNDAALFPDALQALLNAARAQPAPGILTLPQHDWETGALVDRGCLLDPFYNPVPNLDAARTDVAYVIGACLFVPRSLWNDLGGFPQWMESIGEDLFLGCLARLHGYSVRALGVSGYRHRQGASFGGNRVRDGKLSTTFRRRYLSERNKTAVLLSCTPTILVWPLCALHLTALVLEGIVLACVNGDATIWSRIYFASVRGIWTLRSAILASRARSQSARKISLGSYLAAFTPVPRKISLLFRRGIPRLAR